MLVHELGLKITGTELSRTTPGDERVVVPIDEKFPFKRYNFYVMNLESPIPEGDYVLKFNYTGVFTDFGDGISRYEYYRKDDSTPR